MEPKTSQRMRQVMTSLIRQVRGFARANKLTEDERMEGRVALITWPGQVSSRRRNERQLVCGVVGLRS
jgi:catechol 1,2-dioxygenase